MKNFFIRQIVAGLLCLLCWQIGPDSTLRAATDDVYAPPSAAELRQAVLDWLEQRNLMESPVVDATAPEWEFAQEPSANALFDSLMRTFYIADDDVRILVDQCREMSYSPQLLEMQVPSQDDVEPLLTHNVRYFMARYLTLLSAYDAAARLFDQIDITFVVDPAGCLFHRAVCEHHLLNREPGLESLEKLLNQTEDVPLRYRKLGELMREDLQAVEEKSLGEVARQMRDVERRLNLGHAGRNVQEVEERIIATLDELIKKLEEQQQQSSSPSSGSARPNPSNPADESYLGGVRGEGKTDKKDIGHKDNWGDLPAQDRQAVKNLLDRQFPAHYRQAVEEYLKKLAERPAPQR